ncbi:MAG TPA: lanthionine synthetase LanC family protein [Streptosporangiaceae bacterium]|nr:lanthionine synthetase LanC family protein [Streptosporangiaceae bacterium]
MSIEEAGAVAKRALTGDRLPAALARGDWGVPLLARLIAQADPAWCVQARGVAIAWVADRRKGVPEARLFGGGLAGLLAGLTHAEILEPRLASLTDIVRGRLAAWAARQRVRQEGPLSAEYDLITGGSGAVVALAHAPRCQPEEIRPAISSLTALCGAPDLAGLRHRSIEPNPLLRWNAGRRNHGLAHGVPGVLAALIAARPFVADADLRQHLAIVRRLAEYLRDQAVRGERGVITWRRGSGHEPVSVTAARRQAWCYGTPGVAWQLVESGRILDDRELSECGLRAFSSLCQSWDDDYYLRAESRTAQLTLCHGAPGVLAVASTFARRAGLAEAVGLAAHLDEALASRLPTWFQGTDAPVRVLDGTAGTLAVLLAGHDRMDILAALGLGNRTPWIAITGAAAQ